MHLSACGVVNKVASNYTGNGSEVCQDGVVYLQFGSGATVKLDSDTLTPQLCDENGVEKPNTYLIEKLSQNKSKYNKGGH